MLQWLVALQRATAHRQIYSGPVVLNFHGALGRMSEMVPWMGGTDNEKNIEKYYTGKSSGICQLPNLVNIL